MGLQYEQLILDGRRDVRVTETRCVRSWALVNYALACAVPVFSLLTVLVLLSVFRVFTVPQQINSSLPLLESPRQVTFYYDSIVQNGFVNGLLLFYLFRFVTWLQTLLPLHPDTDMSVFEREISFGTDYRYPRPGYGLFRLVMETSLFAGVTVFTSVVIGFVGNMLLYLELFESLGDILFLDIVVRSIFKLIPGIEAVIQNSVGSISNAGVGLRLYFLLTYVAPIALGYLTVRAGATGIETAYHRALRWTQMLVASRQIQSGCPCQALLFSDCEESKPHLAPVVYFALGLVVFLAGLSAVYALVRLISSYQALLVFTLVPLIYSLIWLRSLLINK